VRVNVLGYVRVSTDEQDAGLEVQRESVRAACSVRGWVPVFVEDDGWSAKDLNRPGMELALGLLADGSYDTLVVSKLDRLSRSLLDFVGLVERSRREGWAIVALDLGVDTSTPAGEMMANVLASFAQYERRLIGERTRAALAVKKAQGVPIGRPRSVGVETVGLIRELRQKGLGFGAVAREMNRLGVPTSRGGREWWPSTVRAVCLNG
jgi:DNA invertase Pin-like site-specific DNA recombinase